MPVPYQPIFTDWMFYLTPIQQCQSTEGQRKHLFNSLYSWTTWVSRHQKGKTILDFSEARNDGVAVASAGPYANHLHLAPYR